MQTPHTTPFSSQVWAYHIATKHSKSPASLLLEGTMVDPFPSLSMVPGRKHSHIQTVLSREQLAISARVPAGNVLNFLIFMAFELGCAFPSTCCCIPLIIVLNCCIGLLVVVMIIIILYCHPFEVWILISALAIAFWREVLPNGNGSIERTKPQLGFSEHYVEPVRI